MNVAFDAVMLSLYLRPDAPQPVKVDRLPERISLLIEELEAIGAKVILPTPIIGEFLVLAGNQASAYLAELTTTDVFDIQPFDLMAAVEASQMHISARAKGDKKAGARSVWQVVKVDRQFVAVAKVHGVTTIYSDDADIRTLGQTAGIAVKGVADLPAPPPPNPQQNLWNGESTDDDPKTALQQRNARSKQ